MSAFGDHRLEDLRQAAAAFAEERDWERFHRARSLLLALTSEVGEAADVLRWEHDEDGVPAERHREWAHELADIAIMLVRLADVTDVDLGAAFLDKLAIAARRYPADRFRGSKRKYDAHQAGA